MNPKTVLFATALLLAASGGAQAAAGAAGHSHDGAGGTPGHSHGTAAVGEPAKASAAKRTVRIELHDTYFTPETIRVAAGETVRFVVVNQGQVLHEFNLGTPAMHAAHQKEMAVMMDHGMLTATGIDRAKMAMDHSGMPGMDHAMTHDDPNSVLVEPGRTAELTWTFPKDAALEFACNIPGHYEAGMVGTVEIAR
mgnify:CR=1 FL=1